jgi:hypothetical protein
MIRVVLPAGKSIENVVDDFDSGWRSKHKTWNGTGSPWSDIKEVFVSLQFGKCAYCEQLVQADTKTGKVLSDVEHFRPKNQTTNWTSLDTSITVRSGLASGYSWLATNVQNYALSCKECNSTRKGDRFPIAEVCGRSKQAIQALNAREKPFLLNPLDALEDDPEDLIDWEGFIPFPKIAKSSDVYRHQRAQVIIEFFGLDQRSDVRRGCAEQIWAVWNAFKLLNDPDDGDKHREFLKRCQSENTEVHAACVRAFVRLVVSDRVQAGLEAQKAAKYLAEIKKLYPLQPKPRKVKRVQRRKPKS